MREILVSTKKRERHIGKLLEQERKPQYNIFMAIEEGTRELLEMVLGSVQIQ